MSLICVGGKVLLSLGLDIFGVWRTRNLWKSILANSKSLPRIIICL